MNGRTYFNIYNKWAMKQKMLTDFTGTAIINQPFDLSDSQFLNLQNIRIGTRCSLRLLSALSAVITTASAQDKEEAVITGKLQ